jgi:hypothetical protein
MPGPPSAVLSESFQPYLEGRRLRTAVFFTFSFDPAFFEQEILPVFLSIPLSQASVVRLVQLEDELRQRLDKVAVYYDPRGLLASNQAPRLDVRRIPALISGGYFHPKNIFLLTEPEDPEAPPRQSLIVATLSANLTEAGWWRNVECCHIEVVEEASTFGFRDDLLSLLRTGRAASSDSVSHDALEEVRRFVTRCTQRERISNDRLPARLFGGRTDFVEFLAGATKGRLEGLNMEVIAPYLDDNEIRPLQAMIDAFKPRECRVFLPRSSSGTIACSENYFEALRRVAPACWGQLPKSVLQIGRTEQSGERFVHAKVYRFFHPTRRYEAIVVGSINLTGAAHRRGGNIESAFLIEPELNQVAGWWLSRIDGKKSLTFQGAGEDADLATRSPSIWLTVTYHWDRHGAEFEWRGETPSPLIDLYAAGVHVGRVLPMKEGERRTVTAADVSQIRAGLETTALFTARVDGAEDAPLLVREEGMAMKPSILLTLSAADILRYWSALTREQRLAVLENVALRDASLASALTAGQIRSLVGQRDSFFDNFAQIFQAFENVEQRVRAALEAERDTEAVQRLLGEKYDSLPSLLKKVFVPDNQLDAVSRYLIVLCARQVLEQIRGGQPEFARTHRARFDELLALTNTSEIRRQLDLTAVAQPDLFLEWFETWFVRRAEPRKERSDALS